MKKLLNIVLWPFKFVAYICLAVAALILFVISFFTDDDFEEDI
jgi:hypothetical protein